MADSTIGVLQATSPDKKLDTTSLTVGANTVERERVQVSGGAAAELADVKNALPSDSAYGLVVRPVSSATTATLANVSGSASSVTLLASNTSRRGATIYNDSTALLYVKFGSSASTTSFTVRLAPQGFYELTSNPIYNGIITGIWASATGSARTTEIT